MQQFMIVVCDFPTSVALEHLHSHLLPKIDLTPVAQRPCLLKSDLTPVAQNYLDLTTRLWLKELCSSVNLLLFG
jgi:hypothetical protein